MTYHHLYLYEHRIYPNLKFIKRPNSSKQNVTCIYLDKISVFKCIQHHHYLLNTTFIFILKLDHLYLFEHFISISEHNIIWHYFSGSIFFRPQHFLNLSELNNICTYLNTTLYVLIWTQNHLCMFTWTLHHLYLKGIFLFFIIMPTRNALFSWHVLCVLAYSYHFSWSQWHLGWSRVFRTII